MGGPYQNLSSAEIQQLWQDGQDSLLHYGTSFHPEIITAAQGISIETSSGHRMMDWTSGQMSCLVGHGNPEVVETITRHAQSLDHLFSGMLSPPVIRLGKRLTDLLPRGLDKALFLSTGGESNEAAIRLAKFYTGKYEIVGLKSSWHGMTSGANGRLTVSTIYRLGVFIIKNNIFFFNNNKNCSSTFPCAQSLFFSKKKIGQLAARSPSFHFLVKNKSNFLSPFLLFKK